MTAAARPTSKKRASRVAIVSIALFVAGIVAYFAFRASSRAALDAATNRVAVAGLPLMPSELKPAKDRVGKDPAEWFARVANTKNRWEMRELSVPSTFRPLLESARRRELGDDERVAFEKFEATSEVKKSFP
jgi:hypothetical protein